MQTNVLGILSLFVFMILITEKGSSIIMIKPWRNTTWHYDQGAVIINY